MREGPIKASEGWLNKRFQGKRLTFLVLKMLPKTNGISCMPSCVFSFENQGGDCGEHRQREGQLVLEEHEEFEVP